MDALVWVLAIVGGIFLLIRYKKARWVLAALVSIAVIGVGGYAFNEYWKDRARPLNEMWGIQLGMDLDEVTFRKGKPKESKIEGNRTSLVYEYGYNNDVIAIRIEDNSVQAIMATTQSTTALPFGFSAYTTSQEDIIDKLGEPDTSIKTADGLGRILKYSKYNVVFELRKNRITTWIIVNL